jgi:hypothetical protein
MCEGEARRCRALFFVEPVILQTQKWRSIGSAILVFRSFGESDNEQTDELA